MVTFFDQYRYNKQHKAPKLAELIQSNRTQTLSALPCWLTQVSRCTGKFHTVFPNLFRGPLSIYFLIIMPCLSKLPVRPAEEPYDAYAYAGLLLYLSCQLPCIYQIKRMCVRQGRRGFGDGESCDWGFSCQFLPHVPCLCLIYLMGSFLFRIPVPILVLCSNFLFQVHLKFLAPKFKPNTYVLFHLIFLKFLFWVNY